MPEFVIADSSFLISLYSPEDTNHAKAKEFFEKNEKEILIPFEVLTETFTFLNSAKGIETVRKIYPELQQSKQFHIAQPLERPMHEKAFRRFLSQAKEEKLSYVDCVQLTLAKEKAIKIITFDKKLQNAR